MSNAEQTPRCWWDEEQEAMLEDWIRRYAEERFVAPPDGEERRRVPENPERRNTPLTHSHTSVTDRLSGRKA